MENRGELCEILHHQYEKAFQIVNTTVEGNSRNKTRRYEGKSDTNTFSKEHDIGFHQSPASATSGDTFLLDQPSNLGGIKRRLAINTTL